MAERRTVLAFATQGAGSNDEARILELLADHDVERYAFDRTRKLANVRRIVRMARRVRPALIVMEGTGAAGALAILMARALLGTPYVVSSGDAVGPFLASVRPRFAAPAWAYEWLLYRAAAGFIGWTPYLVGRALTMGAPRGVTAPGFTPHPEVLLSRDEIRDRLGVRRDALVFGIVGGLDYNENKGYCYGLELVRALRRVDREDLAIVVIGGGNGLDRLRELAGEELGRRAFIPGPIPRPLVTSYLASMDVGSLPQSLDQVGALRYTTKISEYVTARLPIVTGRLPLAYDLAEDWSWRLPGPSPWSDDYVDALAALMGSLTRQDIDGRRAAMPPAMAEFDGSAQRRRVGAFVTDLLDDTLGSRCRRAGR
jgi:hypothetical protein